MQRAAPFVAIVCIASAAAVAFVVNGGSVRLTADHFYAAILLAALGVAAEMLNYEYVKGAASGSISNIPFAAAALCSPTWVSVGAIAAASAVVSWSA